VLVVGDDPVRLSSKSRSQKLIISGIVRDMPACPPRRDECRAGKKLFQPPLVSGQETTKAMVRSPSLGEPTSYAIKVAVKAIKMLAAEFARSRDDEEFLALINQAMASETETMKKRFGPKVAA